MTTATEAPKKLADYLTPDDRREVEAVADALDALLVKHRKEGVVPIDQLRGVRWRLDRVARLTNELELEV